MAVCSFLAYHANEYSLYDSDIYDRIRQAVRSVVKREREMDFLFYENSAFSRLCLAAVLENKQRLSELNIRVVAILYQNEYDQYLEQKELPPQLGLCDYLLDHVICVPECCQRERVSFLHSKSRTEWLLKQTSYIISYVYPGFCEKENRCLSAAKEQENIKLLDITDKKTNTAITDSISYLSKTQQELLQNRNDGLSFSQIANVLHKSETIIRQQFQLGVAALRQNIGEQFATMRLQSKVSEPCTCGFLGLRDIRTLSPFRKLLSFLLSSYPITRIYVDQDCAFTAFMSVIKQCTPLDNTVQVIIVTCYPQLSANQWVDIQRQYAIFAPEIKNIDVSFRGFRNRKLAAIQTIIEQSDFCLCDLSRTVFADNIRRNCAKSHSILFDIRQERDCALCNLATVREQKAAPLGAVDGERSEPAGS